MVSSSGRMPGLFGSLLGVLANPAELRERVVLACYLQEDGMIPTVRDSSNLYANTVLVSIALHIQNQAINAVQYILSIIKA